MERLNLTRDLDKFEFQCLTWRNAMVWFYWCMRRGRHSAYQSHWLLSAPHTGRLNSHKQRRGLRYQPIYKEGVIRMYQYGYRFVHYNNVQQAFLLVGLDFCCVSIFSSPLILFSSHWFILAYDVDVDQFSAPCFILSFHTYLKRKISVIFFHHAELDQRHITCKEETTRHPYNY